MSLSVPFPLLRRHVVVAQKLLEGTPTSSTGHRHHNGVTLSRSRGVRRFPPTTVVTMLRKILVRRADVLTTGGLEGRGDRDTGTIPESLALACAGLLVVEEGDLAQALSI